MIFLISFSSGIENIREFPPESGILVGFYWALGILEATTIRAFAVHTYSGASVIYEFLTVIWKNEHTHTLQASTFDGYHLKCVRCTSSIEATVFLPNFPFIVCIFPWKICGKHTWCHHLFMHTNWKTTITSHMRHTVYTGKWFALILMLKVHVMKIFTAPQLLQIFVMQSKLYTRFTMWNSMEIYWMIVRQVEWVNTVRCQRNCWL